MGMTTVDRDLIRLAGQELGRRIVADQTATGQAINSHPGDDTGKVLADLWKSGKKDQVVVLWAALIERVTESTDPEHPNPPTAQSLREHLGWAIADQEIAEQIKAHLRASRL